MLAGVDLEISPGLTLLLGPNGCGKSTLLKLAAGIERPDSGRVEIDGHDLWIDEVAARRGLAYVPEQPDLTPYATVREILDLVCRLRGEPARARREALERVGLGKLAHRSVRELSMGQRRRAVLAAALRGHARATPCSTSRSRPWTAAPARTSSPGSTAWWPPGPPWWWSPTRSSPSLPGPPAPSP